MRRPQILLLLAAALTALLVACDDKPTQRTASPTPADGTFVESACMMPLPTGQREEDVRCGFVTVSQNPSRNDGAHVKLAIAVLAATCTGNDTDGL